MQEKLEHRKLKINFETNNQFWQCRGASSVYGQERWEFTPNPRGWKGSPIAGGQGNHCVRLPHWKTEEKETLQCCSLELAEALVAGKALKVGAVEPGKFRHPGAARPLLFD